MMSPGSNQSRHDIKLPGTAVPVTKQLPVSKAHSSSSVPSFPSSKAALSTSCDGVEVPAHGLALKSYCSLSFVAEAPGNKKCAQLSWVS